MARVKETVGRFQVAKEKSAAAAASKKASAGASASSAGAKGHASAGRKPVAVARPKVARAGVKPGKSMRATRDAQVALNGGISYKTYIFKILRTVHAKLGVSSKAMCVIDGMVIDLINRITTNAIGFLDRGKAVTLTKREVDAAVRELFPGELGKHGVAQIAKTIHQFERSQAK